MDVDAPASTAAAGRAEGSATTSRNGHGDKTGKNVGDGGAADEGRRTSKAAAGEDGDRDGDGDVVMLAANEAPARAAGAAGPSTSSSSSSARSAPQQLGQRPQEGTSKGNASTATPNGTHPTPARTSQANVRSASLRDDEEEIPPSELQWLWSAKEWDDWTPSRAAGLDKHEERNRRYQGVKFMYQMADRLALFGHVLHTAATYFHRFFLRKPMKSKISENSSTGYDIHEIAVACVFLASKNEEQHRKLASIIEAAIATVHYNTGGQNPLGQNTPENFRKWRDTIIAYEDELFSVLCADLVIAQPIAMFVEACRIFEVGREQIYNGINLLHDINRDIYCQLWEANVQAATAFHAVHLMAGLDYDEYTIPMELAQIAPPCSDEDRLWLTVFGCEYQDVRQCGDAIRAFYKWRDAAVKNTRKELVAERTRRTRSNAATPARASLATSTPLHPGSMGATNGNNATPSAMSSHHSTEPTVSTHLRANGHRALPRNHSSSTLSSTYTPELGSSQGASFELPTSSQPSGRDGPTIAGDGPTSSSATEVADSRDRWRAISAPAHHQAQPGGGQDGGFGGGHDGSTYTLESPKLNQEDGDEEEEGQHDPAPGPDAASTGGPLATSTAMAGVAPFAHTRSSSVSHGLGVALPYDGPVSPVMPVDDGEDDAEEGAVDDDV